MVNLKKVDPTVRLRIYKERLETMPDKYKPKGLDKGNEACYSDNKINNMNIITAKDLKPVTQSDKVLKMVLDRASTKTVETDPDVCEECGSMIHEVLELREGGYHEIVRYCYGCVATQT